MLGDARMFLFRLMGLIACLRCSASEHLSFPDFQGVDSAANWLARKGLMILSDSAADPHAHTLNGIAGAKFRQVCERFGWVTGQSSRMTLRWLHAFRSSFAFVPCARRSWGRPLCV